MERKGDGECEREHRAESTRAARHLMRAADEVEVVLVEELGDHLGAERERHAAVVLAPAGHVCTHIHRPNHNIQQTNGASRSYE